ncbi:alginate lyase family protein [Flagellimonas eckloniae]|uniref:alginate lyase family protein n=1 Tax=Flagellimonas eckloniae TaxID=346185 RepID=UPI0006DC1300|nr:alginate lyase family protein [Allomuricauda eckloniae]
MYINSFKLAVLVIFFVKAHTFGQDFTAENKNDPKENHVPKTNTIPVISSTLTSLNYDNLLLVKQAIKNESETYLPAYEKLLEAADNALEEGPFSVIQKKKVAASGDKHDYLSLAPYWWPDPEKTDGLPWIRKDGEVNPVTRGENVDKTAKNKMFNNVSSLSLAYFFSDDEKYADKIKKLLKVWFVDEATRMNPNLNHAQGIPGENTGRGFGIIEFSGVVNILTAIEILQLNQLLEPDLDSAIKQWMDEYLKWLQTSEFGLFEKSRTNNHGTLYDVQEVALLLFFDKTAEAKAVLENVFEKRIAEHIEADGSQPNELKRTKALTYSILNLSGLTKLAFYGRKEGVNVDLWNQKSPDGDMQKAYDYLYPYLNKENSWPYEQLGDMDKAIERLRRMFVTSGSMLSIEKYCQIASELKGSDNLQQLTHPCLP